MGKIIWTREAVMAKALEFSIKKDFQKKAPGAYASARLSGTLLDVCAHMTRRILPDEALKGRNCTKCNIFKSPDLMSKDSRNKSRIGSLCKACHSLRTSEYAAKNVSWKRAMTAKRRAMRANATPPWLTEDHMSEIRLLYNSARKISVDTGIQHEVDHILPIGGATICGLHVPWNLQVLPKVENRQKSNRVSHV